MSDQAQPPEGCVRLFKGTQKAIVEDGSPTHERFLSLGWSDKPKAEKKKAAPSRAKKKRSSSSSSKAN